MPNKRKGKKSSKDKEMILTLPIPVGRPIKKLADKKETVKNQKNSSDNIFTLGTQSSSEDNYESVDSNVRELLVKLEDKENLIRSLREELKIYKSSGKITFHGQKKVKKVDFKISKLDGEIKIKDDYMCWWCHHDINSDPVFLPDRYSNKTYYVTGIFCSYPCAAKYNACTLDDYRTSERYTFLKQMYNEIYNNNKDIKLAEDWRFLKKHGGYMSIEEFRAKSHTDVSDCSVVYPPMYFSNPALVEIAKSGIIAPSEDKLVLKRSKPLPRSNNTLMDSMGLVLEKKN